MQLLLIHSDYIEFEAKRPTKMAEEIEDSHKKGRLEEALCAFIAVEKFDEDDPEAVIAEGVKQITDVASQVHANRIRIWRIALSLGLRGYVKNLPDGAVQAVVEGIETDLEKFADDVLAVRARSINVSAVEKCYSPATGEFKTFEILWDERDAELYEVAEVLIEAFDSQTKNPD